MVEGTHPLNDRIPHDWIQNSRQIDNESQLKENESSVMKKITGNFQKGNRRNFQRACGALIWE